jgi:hypothetical protein
LVIDGRHHDLYCTLNLLLASTHLPVLHSINNTCTDIHLRQLSKLKLVEEKAFPWFCEPLIPFVLRYSMHAIYVFLAVLAVATRAHMSLWYPPPLGGSLQANPLTTQVDNELNFPIGCCDSDGRPTLPSPGDCRGHLNLLNTEEGRPQVTWEPGQDAYFQLSDHTYSREHNRFPVLQSASFSPHGPPGKGPTALVLAYRRDGSVIIPPAVWYS